MIIAKDAFDTMGFKAGDKVCFVGETQILTIIAIDGTNVTLNNCTNAHVTKIRKA